MQESSRPELTKEKYDHYFENVVKRKENTYSDYQKIDFELGVFDSFSFLMTQKKIFNFFFQSIVFRLLMKNYYFILKKLLIKESLKSLSK